MGKGSRSSRSEAAEYAAASDEEPDFEAEAVPEPSSGARQRRGSKLRRKSSSAASSVSASSSVSRSSSGSGSGSSSSRRSRRSKSKSKYVDNDESVLEAGRYLRSVLAVLLVGWLVVDWLSMGLRGNSTALVDWWDLIGTAAYVRGRNPRYSLRDARNQKPGWALYVVLVAFVLFEVSGKLARTVMRHSLVLPSVAGFVDFVVYGFLPVHLIPGDYFFKVCEQNDIHQLLVAAFWATTKTRSVFRTLSEGVGEHGYSPLQGFLLIVMACETASVLSRADLNFNSYAPTVVAKRLPVGLFKWLTGRTFVSSLFIAAFAQPMVRLDGSPVGALAGVAVLAACFYRYSNGLLERSVAKYILPAAKAANLKAAEAGAVDGGVDGEAASVAPNPTPTLDDLRPKNVRRALEKLEVRFQGLLEAAPDFIQARAALVPAAAAVEAEHLAGALRVAVRRLNQDTHQSVDALSVRLDEIAYEVEHGAKHLGSDMAQASGNVSRDVAKAGRDAAKAGSSMRRDMAEFGKGVSKRLNASTSRNRATSES